jgi:lipopolysaccharide export system protein LptC
VSLDLDSLIQPLDPLPVSGPQNPPPRPRQPFWWRIGQVISAYLPLLLMALLALATWWLVQNTPRLPDYAEAGPARHEPDYTMQGFAMQRYAADGSVRVKVRGVQMRHYPDTDTIEIDNVTIDAYGADGRVTVATAERALANADASEVQLIGRAHVVYDADGAAAGSEPIEFDSEFLHLFTTIEQLRSNRPVRLRQGTSEMHMASLDYNHLTQTARLGGPVRARFEVPARR